MPYAIRKIGKPSKPFCVVNTETNDNKGCSSTMKDAKKHLAVLNMREHGVPKKKESEMATETPEVPQAISIPAEYAERLKNFEEAAIVYLGDRAPTPRPFPVAVEPAPPEPDVAPGLMEKVAGNPIAESPVATELPADTVEQYVGGIEPIPEQKVATVVTEEQKETQLLLSADLPPDLALVPQATQPQAIQKEVSLDRQSEMVRSAFYAKFPNRHNAEVRGPYVREVFSSYVIAERGGNLLKYTYKQTKEGFDFSDPTPVNMEVNYIEKDISYGQVIRAVRHAFREKFPPDMFPDGAPYVFEVFQDYIVARRKDKTYKYTYGVKDGVITFGDPAEVEVEVVYHEKKEAEGVLAQVKSLVKDIWDKIVKTEEQQESPTLDFTLPIFITKEQADGQFRWISISNTAFLDREGEIVSTKGVADSIARADLVGYHGDLRFWHERSIVLGTCDLQAQDGVCLIESGLWHNTPLAKSVREGIAKSPISWGKSIGFYPLTAPQEGVVIKGATVRRLWTDLQIVERSILPNSEAASLFTQITTRGLSMEQKKKDALVELLGDEALVNEVLAKADEINKAAAGPDAIVKEADTPSNTEEIKESQPGGEKATQTETVNTEVKEGGDPVPNAEGDDNELLVILKTMGTQIQSLAAQVKALQESQSAPRMSLHRPILASKTADDADGDVQKETSSREAPRAVQAMRHQVLGTG